MVDKVIPRMREGTETTTLKLLNTLHYQLFLQPIFQEQQHSWQQCLETRKRHSPQVKEMPFASLMGIHSDLVVTGCQNPHSSSVLVSGNRAKIPSTVCMSYPVVLFQHSTQSSNSGQNTGKNGPLADASAFLHQITICLR